MPHHIESRKKSCRQPLSENSHVMLWDTVFQLIDYHQDYDQLLTEASSLKRVKNEKDEAESKDGNTTSGMFDNNIMSLIFSDGYSGKSSSALHLSTNCATRIVSILPKSGQILDTYSKTEIQRVINFIKQLIMDNSFNQAKFLSLLFKENFNQLQIQATLPLELLWILNMEAIVSFDVYLNSKLSDSKLISIISSQIHELNQESQQPHVQTILASILGTVFNIGFGEKKDNSEETAALKKACVGVVERVYIDFVEHPNNETRTDHSWLSRVRSFIEITMETMKRGCVHLLSMLVSHKPEMKVSQAIQQQTEWVYGKIPISIIEVFKQLLLPFEVTEVTHLLMQVFDSQEINWQLFLSLVSVIFICLPESTKIFTDLIQKLLLGGLEACDMEKTIMGLLLARQGCLQGPHVFLSYPEWFQRTFGDSSRSPANSRKTFTFLMKLLTDLVPFEAANHLKAHILRPPYVPSKCRDLLSDYIILAKTRLADLKESLDIDGHCGDSSNSHKALEQVEKDVEKSISSFETNGKMPASVMEASIFKKPYYIGRFLPSLLKPRPYGEPQPECKPCQRPLAVEHILVECVDFHHLPDVPDTRMKFIEVLRKQDKIPENLYNNYLKACKKEAAQLLEGVFINDDSDDVMDDMLQSPLDQLKKRLQQLTDVITDKSLHHDQTKHKVPELLSIIQEKLDNLHKVEKHEDVSHIIELDPTRTQIDQNSIQMGDIVLNCITRTVHFVYQSNQPQFTWLRQLVSISVQKRGLCRTLYARLWKLLVEQGSRLEEHHIQGLAALCVELHIAQDNIPRLRIAGREHQPEGSFTQILIQYLQMSTGTQMIFLLRFASMYLQYVFCAFDDLIVDSTNISAPILPDLVKKFAFLCTRCIPELCYKGRKLIDDEAVFPNKEWIFQLYSCEKFQQILQQVKLTFSEWVELEIRMHPEQDLLNVVQRFDHYTWALYRKYLPLDEKDGGCSNDYKLAASLILEKLIHSYTSQQTPIQECARCSETQSFSRLTNSSEMVSVLQGLVISFHDENNVDDDQSKTPRLPWLLDYLAAREARDTQEVSTNAKVTAFFRLYMCLPSYLLFMNSLSPHSWAPLSKKRITDMLNKHLIMLDTGDCLPLSLTTNIIKGLSAVESVTGKEVMKEILVACPLVMVSVMIHFENLKHIIKRTSCLQTIFDLLEQIDSTFDEGETIFLASCGKDLDGSVISLALFSATLKRKSHHGVLSTLEKMAKHREILSIYAELLLCYCARNEQLWQSNGYLYNTNVVRGILADLLTSHQVLHCLCIANEAQTVVHGIFPAVVFKLKHITLIRIICQCGSLSISSKEGNLTQILILFRTVSAMFESVLESEENRKLPAIKDPLTVMDLIAASRFIKRCIQEAPTAYLQILDQSLLTECGTEVQEEVHRRLSAEGFR